MISYLFWLGVAMAMFTLGVICIPFVRAHLRHRRRRAERRRLRKR